MNRDTASFLGLEGLHVFITGANGGIGREASREFLRKYWDFLFSDMPLRV